MHKFKVDEFDLYKWFIAETDLDKLNGITEQELEKKVYDFCEDFDKKGIFEDVLSLNVPLLKLVKSNVSMSLEQGYSLVKEGYIPWVNRRWKELPERFYWDSFHKFLKSGLKRPTKIITELDKKSDEILDYCGDPTIRQGTWKKRGLVIGEVQSGKTSLYTALINKAADAGYKLIIVLAGVTENLRVQTQDRLDSDFIGKPSNISALFPVGRPSVIKWRLDQTRVPITATTTVKDFGASSLKGVSFNLNSVKEPILFVVKKNQAVLRRLNEWLEKKNRMSNSPSINQTLLVIDDEADNASINTKDGDTPTAINYQIRKLLNLFSFSTYIGFTATPFANVFIDSDEDDDLFPSDFILTMAIPANYFGVDKLFESDSEDPAKQTVREISDDEEKKFLSLKHDKTARPKISPNLRTAVIQFFLINALRDLRGEERSHRSMLINVSRFTNVQNLLKEEVETFAEDLKGAIQIFSQHPEALNNESIAEIKKVFDKDFYDCGSKWEEVLSIIPRSVQDIKCLVVNQSKKAERLDYGIHREGLRVIVVGGLSLSRGFTLEGLCVSYLYRTTACYDTLMQMGRWFGYRTNYEDLCKVWMRSKTREYYWHIARATTELKEDMWKMKLQGLTPRDFGIKVRESPDALQITARNKMRNSSEVEITNSFSSYFIETPRIEKKNFERNRAATEKLLKAAMEDEAVKQISIKGKYLLKNVDKTLIAEFIETFKTLEGDYRFANFEDDSHGLNTFVRFNTIPKLQKWDVLVWGTEKEEFPVELHKKISVNCIRRSISSFEIWDEKGILSIKNNRITGKESEAFPLSEVEKEEIKKEYESRSAGRPKETLLRKAYREKRLHPLLILLPVIPQLSINEVENEVLTNQPVMTFALSFCAYGEDNSSSHNKVTYKINNVMLHQMNEQFEEEEFSEDED